MLIFIIKTPKRHWLRKVGNISFEQALKSRIENNAKLKGRGQNSHADHMQTPEAEPIRIPTILLIKNPHANAFLRLRRTVTAESIPSKFFKFCTSIPYIVI